MNSLVLLGTGAVGALVLGVLAAVATLCLIAAAAGRSVLRGLIGRRRMRVAEEPTESPTGGRPGASKGAGDHLGRLYRQGGRREPPSLVRAGRAAGGSFRLY
jgi:hypothetical protein